MSNIEKCYLVFKCGCPDKESNLVGGIENYIYSDLGLEFDTVLHKKLNYWIFKREEMYKSYSNEMSDSLIQLNNQFELLFLQKDIERDSAENSYELCNRINRIIGKLVSNPLMYDFVRKQDNNLIQHLSKYIFEFKESTTYSYELISILDLNRVLKDSLIRMAKCPYHVKAKLGDRHIQDSLITLFNNQLRDTISFAPINKKLVSDLLYINSPSSCEAFFNSLSYDRLVFEKLDDNRVHKEGFDSWVVQSSQVYLISCYNSYSRNKLRFINKIIGKELFYNSNGVYLGDILAGSYSKYFKEEYGIDISINSESILTYEYRISPPPGEKVNDAVLEYTYGDSFKTLMEEGFVDPYNMTITYKPDLY